MTPIQPKKRASVPAPPDTNTYFSLKFASCPKAGQRSSGKIDYRLLTDSERSELYLTIVGNDGAGYFSREIVALNNIERCLASVPAEQSFPAKVLQPAFLSRSVNNAGFLLAVLKAEGLVIPVADKVHLHRRSGADWKHWQQELLKQNGEPFQAEPKAELQTLTHGKHPVDGAQQPETEAGRKGGPGKPQRKGKVQLAEPLVEPNDTAATSDATEQENTMPACSPSITFEDPDDPIAVLMGRKPRHWPGDKHQHPTWDEEEGSC
ncbi:MAG: hypothetical protein ACXV79_03385 [Methylobacter sp.]